MDPDGFLNAHREFVALGILLVVFSLVWYGGSLGILPGYLAWVSLGSIVLQKDEKVKLGNSKAVV